MTTKAEYPTPGLGTYNVNYSCGNCGWSGVKAFLKGKTAPLKIMCPKCDCLTADKPWRGGEWLDSRSRCILHHKIDNGEERCEPWRKSQWIPHYSAFIGNDLGD